MATRSATTLPLLLLLLLVTCFSASADLQLARSFILKACNHTIPEVASFSPTCLQPLLSMLIAETPSSGYNFKGRVTHKHFCHSFGHAICLETLNEDECRGCLSFLADSVLPLCGIAVGARLELPACFLRYEEFDF